MPAHKPYTFAIRSNHRSNPKLQKSMSCQHTDSQERESTWHNNVYKSLGSRWLKLKYVH